MSAVRESPRILRAEETVAARPVSAASWSRLASHGVLAAGIIMLFGVVVDLGILWLYQRESSAQWEFTAIANTVESVPRLVFAIGFLYAAAYLRGVTRMGAYRVLGSLLIFVGLLSIALAGLLALSYFQLGSLVTQPEVYTMLRSVAMKTIAVCAVYALVAIPFGVLSLRRPLH